MPRKAKEKGSLEVRRLSSPGYHFVGGVDGVALQVTHSGARSWVLRAMVAGKRRDIGLGGFPDVTLAVARERARNARDKIAAGVDPIEEKRAARAALAAARASAITFKKAATEYIAAQETGWKNAKHASQWRNTLETYAYPVIGEIFVAEISTEHVMKVLNPIWAEKTETASRVRGRVESVLNWATARGYRSGENPARWRGHLENLLAARSKVQKVVHHAALPYKDVAQFMRELRMVSGQGARALELAILTAARSNEVRGATWGEFDLDSGLWTVPAERMKAGKEHWVPLSDQALRLLRRLPMGDPDEIVFPNSKGTPLSDMTLTAVLRRMKYAVTAHGFRSTFRDWAGEIAHHEREVIEHALAHQLKDKAEAAYARGTMLPKRTRLMADWGNYCDKVAPKTSGTVIGIGHRKKA